MWTRVAPIFPSLSSPKIFRSFGGIVVFGVLIERDNDHLVLVGDSKFCARFQIIFFYCQKLPSCLGIISFGMYILQLRCNWVMPSRP